MKLVKFGCLPFVAGLAEQLKARTWLLGLGHILGGPLRPKRRVVGRQVKP